MVGDAAAARRVQRTGLQSGDEGAPAGAAAAEAARDVFEAHPLRVALRLDGGLEAGRATLTLGLGSFPLVLLPLMLLSPVPPPCAPPRAAPAADPNPTPTQPQPTPASPNLTQVSFSYLAELQMVGVSAAPPAAAKRLATLFQADDGGCFPDERCALRALARRDATDGAAPRLPDLGAMLPARPFKWAQWLAGLGPVRPLTPPTPPPVATLPIPLAAPARSLQLALSRNEHPPACSITGSRCRRPRAAFLPEGHGRAPAGVTS